MKLGNRLKAIRSGEGMTLAELATSAGVSKSMLSRIERNEAAPTVTTLQKIAVALDTPMARFLDEGDATDSIVPPEFGGGAPLSDADRALGSGLPPATSVVRAGMGKKMSLPWGANYDMLTPDLQRHIEFILISYPVDGGSGDFYAHEGEECGFVVEGRFKGFVGDEEFTLEAGDSIYYSSSIPHRWENAGDVEARAVWAVTPPSFLKGRLSE
jgi:transcriptional regulator with XRE-family HTH domain/mannose-6-phosphate isomerase-like protein (cupin superfamily)